MSGGGGVPGYVPAKYRSWVAWAARRTGLPPSVVAAQINDESGFQPGVVSSAGAQGIAQFEPGTWATWGHGSPFNPPDAFRAYAAFMRALLHQFHGNARDALAAYNAGAGNIQAGYGYADTILHNAGQSGSLKAGKGTGGGPGPGAGQGTQQAQLTSFSSSATSAVKSAGTLLHGSAVVLDRAFAMFAPGQGWRIVFGAGAVAGGVGAYKAFSRGEEGGEDGPGGLPLAIALLGVAAVCGFLAFRPWPQASGRPIKPGAYVVDVIKGEPPPAGPAAFSQSEVQLTEAGLGALVGLWAAGKIAQSAGAIAQGASGIAGALGSLWSWVQGLGSSGAAEDL